MVAKMQYAIRDGMLVHIDDVEKGLKCGCLCPACESQLIARKGKVKVHHFAHYNSEECSKGIETTLHLLAKEILAEEMCIKLPSLYLEFDSYKDKELMYKEMTYEFDKVYLEKKFDNIIPDINLESKGNKLFVEIFVTHDIDEIKLEKIEKLGISSLLIDLSELEYSISKDELREILINDVEKKRWIYNRRQNAMSNRFKDKAKPFEDASKGDGTFCPQYLYGWKGVSSARWVDCLSCEYCFSITGNFNCLGYSGVSKIIDLDNPQLADRARKLKQENRIKPRWLEGTQCTGCKRGYMALKSGKNGSFLGCSNYPSCRNTIKIV